MTEKKELRQRMKALRQSAYAPRASSRTIQRLRESPLWRQAGVIALYAPLPYEIDVYPLFEEIWREGGIVALPRILDEGQRKMDFFALRSLEELEAGPFGLRQPPLSNALAPDLLALPGLAFDRQGYRLGYGGGYYDRYFADRPDFDAPVIGLCQRFQILPQLPHDEWDRKVDAIFCEDGCLWP